MVHLFKQGGSFVLIANVGGVQHFETLHAANKTEAKTERDRRLAELRSPGSAPIADRSLRFNDLAGQWVAFESDPTTRTIKERTLELRRGLLKAHVQSIIGAERGVTINVFHVRGVIERARKKGLSGSTVRSIVTSLSVVLEHAASRGNVERNVCRDLTRKDLPSAARETEPRYLQRAEVEALFVKLGPEFRVIAQTLFYGALRISEALSLTWRDVDFERGLIYVRSGKTKASVAPVPLFPELVAILKEHRQTAIEQGRYVLGGSSLIFQTATGRPQGRRNTLRAIQAASTAAGLDVTETRERDGKEVTVHVGCHDLRHSAATLAHDAGVKVEVISRLLRHASPAITQAIYIGRLRSQEDEALDVGREIAAAFGGVS